MIAATMNPGKVPKVPAGQKTKQPAVYVSSPVIKVALKPYFFSKGPERNWGVNAYGLRNIG
jgi:hypothetical protein